jgi:hypothetical protein
MPSELCKILGSSNSKYCGHCSKLRRQATCCNPVGARSVPKAPGWLTITANTVHNIRCRLLIKRCGPYNEHFGKTSCPYRAVPHGTRTKNQYQNSCSLRYFKLLVTICVCTSQKMIWDKRSVVKTVDYMRLSYFILYFFVLNSIIIDLFKVLLLMYKIYIIHY